MGNPPEQTPAVNALRISETGEVEFYDGSAWQPYLELSDDGPGPGPVVKDEGHDDR
ncbi:hypothetical protein GCM10009530_61970 [Microbispora corallina]|uniref:Uncharacterized protein n=1 Tax=Microbispora corallina TaxID=83302 RepID=A0ABQ4G8J5_9ACTN|nr:hypothetical protein [Microbispora corallina]GIH43382.1 hypothetical protein Mco01_63820 [Microbispora corallina]